MARVTGAALVHGETRVEEELAAERDFFRGRGVVRWNGHHPEGRRGSRHIGRGGRRRGRRGLRGLLFRSTGTSRKGAHESGDARDHDGSGNPRSIHGMALLPFKAAILGESAPDSKPNLWGNPQDRKTRGI